MTDVVIASACRTPIGKFQGALAGLSAPQLGAHVLREALARAGVRAEDVNEVIMGCVLTAGVGQAPARQASRAAGIPDHTSALTVNKVCGSGLKAVVLAAQAIKCGDADVVLAGGMESMSSTPYYLPQARDGLRLGHGKVIDGIIQDGLWDPYYDMHMGLTAEAVCKEYGVSREAQDQWAVESHRRAVAAQKAGRFKAEIAPVEMKPKKGDPWSFDTDEGPRADATLEALGKLRPAFDKTGLVTAGNSSTINDGAAALVVTSAERAKALKLTPLARITGYATGGTDPKWVMMAPVEAVKNLEARTGARLSGFDLIELNEAFASQCVAVSALWKADAARINVNGGAVALGHPIGASGARILTTLIHALRDRKLKTGLATLCLGGGGAVAMSVETL
ncbi:MAG TPA: acetyl-CoA C-acetyltransferase [Planctomycetota bacterium]|nr:acetyl-CoA C-acetyltransferase [Planctomycetota bacterium]